MSVEYTEQIYMFKRKSTGKFIMTGFTRRDFLLVGVSVFVSACISAATGWIVHSGIRNAHRLSEVQKIRLEDEQGANRGGIVIEPGSTLFGLTTGDNGASLFITVRNDEVSMSVETRDGKGRRYNLMKLEGAQF